MIIGYKDIKIGDIISLKEEDPPTIKYLIVHSIRNNVGHIHSILASGECFKDGYYHNERSFILCEYSDIEKIIIEFERI